jgi:hypothetical protein
VHFKPTFEILPFIPETKVGDRNSGLKIISVRKEGRILHLNLEGLANKNYSIQALNLHLAAEISGAERGDGKLLVKMPEGSPGQFVSHKITVKMQ